MFKDLHPITQALMAAVLCMVGMLAVGDPDPTFTSLGGLCVLYGLFWLLRILIALRKGQKY